MDADEAVLNKTVSTKKIPLTVTGLKIIQLQSQSEVSCDLVNFYENIWKSFLCFSLKKRVKNLYLRQSKDFLVMSCVGWRPRRSVSPCVTVRVATSRISRPWSSSH
jgi:hypothetical protein